MILGNLTFLVLCFSFVKVGKYFYLFQVVERTKQAIDNDNICVAYTSPTESILKMSLPLFLFLFYHQDTHHLTDRSSL